MTQIIFIWLSTLLNHTRNTNKNKSPTPAGRAISTSQALTSGSRRRSLIYAKVHVRIGIPDIQGKVRNWRLLDLVLILGLPCMTYTRFWDFLTPPSPLLSAKSTLFFPQIWVICCPLDPLWWDLVYTLLIVNAQKMESVCQLWWHSH